MPSLEDFLTRHQIHLEGVKNWAKNDLLRYIKRFAAEIKKLLGGIDADKLAELSKARLNALLKRIDAAFNKIMGEYGTDFYRQFRRITGIDTVVQRGAFAVLREGTDFTAVTIGKVWKDASERIVSAYGMTPKETIADYLGRAKLDVVTTIRSAAADSIETAEAVANIVGKTKDFAQSSLGRMFSRGRTLVNTVVQHGSAVVSELMGRLVYGCYQWVSIIDGVTSNICRTLNGQVFRYGDGPMPPAHNNCRSRAVPCDCDNDTKPRSYYAWLKAQPEAFLKAEFGAEVAAIIASGNAVASEYLKFASVNTLTPDQFELKANLLTI